MVKITDLPIRSCIIGEFLFQPRKLLRIHVIRIENKETDIAFFEGIVLLSIHVKELIETLVGVIVVAQGGVKLYAGIDQCLIGRLELLYQGLWTFMSVNVVAQHNYKIERKLCPVFHHALRDIVLGFISVSHIPNGGEANRAGFHRESDILRPQRPGWPMQKYNKEKDATPHILSGVKESRE